MELFWGFYRTPAEKRDWPRINLLVARCAEHFALLDRQLAEESNLAGTRISMADIPAGTALYRYFELAIEHPAVPNVTAWYERLQLRAPYRQHVMLPFDDLRGRLQY
jgi:glutathione S-transferase